MNSMNGVYTFEVLKNLTDRLGRKYFHNDVFTEVFRLRKLIEEYPYEGWPFNIKNGIRMINFSNFFENQQKNILFFYNKL